MFQELRKRDITMVDKSLAEINVTIWGTAAESFDPTGNPVVAIKGAKVSDYNNVSLSTLGSSVIQVHLTFYVAILFSFFKCRDFPNKGQLMSWKW